MKKINPFLWFDSEAEQAVKFYVGIFKNSKIGKITHYDEDGIYARQSRLRGAQPRKLSGQFKFTEAISFAVNCET